MLPLNPSPSELFIIVFCKRVFPNFEEGARPRLTRASSAIKEDGDSEVATVVLFLTLTFCIFPHAAGT